jgi:hypothetical protein
MESLRYGFGSIIVDVIVAGKFMYRWQATKQVAKEAEERKIMVDKTKYMSI